jgi:hypothetical protein
VRVVTCSPEADDADHSRHCAEETGGQFVVSKTTSPTEAGIPHCDVVADRGVHHGFRRSASPGVRGFGDDGSCATSTGGTCDGRAVRRVLAAGSTPSRSHGDTMRTVAVTRSGASGPPTGTSAARSASSLPDQELTAEDVWCACARSAVRTRIWRRAISEVGSAWAQISGVIEELGGHRGLKVGDRIAGNFLRFCGTAARARRASSSSARTSRTTAARHVGVVVWHESQV